MKRIKGMIIVLLFPTIILSLLPIKASACSCIAPQPVATELNKKTAVFSGKAINIKQTGGIFQQSTDDPVFVTFEVKEIWKGVNSSQVIVKTERDGASCGFGFHINKEYIVYAYGDSESGHLATSICERTKLLSTASEDLAVLGKGEVPTKKVDLSKESNKKSITLYTVITAVSLISLIILILIIKKFKKSKHNQL